MDAISCLPPLPAATYHLSTSAAIARALNFPMPASSAELDPCSSSSPLFADLVPGSVGNWFPSAHAPMPMVESVVVASTPGPGNASKRQQQQQLGLGPRAGKRRAKRRPSKRAPTTYICTDTANFRFMVQHVTGAHHADGLLAVDVVDGFLSPAAASASNLLLAQDAAAPYGCGAAFSNKDDGGMILVAEDGAAALQQQHQHRQQQVQPQQQACFPTLDSWSVIYHDPQI